jgi:hypothetical protein
MGEPNDSPPGDGELLVADAVTLERRTRAVMPVAVGLDDQPHVGPVEVDFEALDRRVHRRPSDLRAVAQRQERVFERAPRSGGEVMRGEDRCQPATDLARIEQAERFRGLRGLLYLPSRQVRSREVDQCAGK